MILYSDDEISKLSNKIKECYDLIRAIKTRTERKRVKEYNDTIFTYREKLARSHLFPDEFFKFINHDDVIQINRTSKGIYCITMNCACLYERRWRPDNIVFVDVDNSIREIACPFQCYISRDFYHVRSMFPHVVAAYLNHEYSQALTLLEEIF